MGLFTDLKKYIVRKNIYDNGKNEIFKISSNEYLLKNKAVHACIKTHEYNNQPFLIFNVRKADSNEPLVNFAILYDICIPIEHFIIQHSQENPIFMIDELDISSVSDCRILMIKSRANNILSSPYPIFIHRKDLNRDAYEFSLTTQVEQLHHIMYRANNFYHAIKFKFDNDNHFFIGDVEYQIISIRKKKITKLVSKFTLGYVDKEMFIDILTVYDINSVICVLKNVFDMVALGRDKEWLLYTEGHELNDILSQHLRYLDSYIDIFKTPMLFHKNSPCLIKKDKNKLQISYIDGYRSGKVQLTVLLNQYEHVYGLCEKTTQREMNVFFKHILEQFSHNVFDLCAKSPSQKLLNHLSNLGFPDCIRPIDSGIIEVLKMHDY